MSREYVQAQVDKIIKEEGHEFPENIALASAWICGNLKGINLKILDVSHTSSLSDYFVLASATNFIQAKAMAEEIMHHLKRHGHEIRSKEGMEDSDWILIDVGDIIVHLFLDASRTVYGLEELWKEASSIAIPETYYFDGEDAEAAAKINADKDRDFF